MVHVQREPLQQRARGEAWCALWGLHVLHVRLCLQSLTIEEFERIAKSTFPLKSDVDIKNMTDVVRKQLKLKMSQNDINLDRLFKEVLFSVNSYDQLT